MDLFAPNHIILILLALLLLFGGRKIPELMRGLGRGFREFKEAKEPPVASTDTSAEVKKN